jgi:hypothetical protein
MQLSNCSISRESLKINSRLVTGEWLLDVLSTSAGGRGAKEGAREVQQQRRLGRQEGYSGPKLRSSGVVRAGMKERDNLHLVFTASPRARNLGAPFHAQASSLSLPSTPCILLETYSRAGVCFSRERDAGSHSLSRAELSSARSTFPGDGELSVVFDEDVEQTAVFQKKGRPLDKKRRARPRKGQG